MKIFMTMAETAEALGYKHDYFQNHWRRVCRNLRAPFPVNSQRHGALKWRRSELEAYANGRNFDPPSLIPANSVAAPRAAETVTSEEVDWDAHFKERARAALAH